MGFFSSPALVDTASPRPFVTADVRVGKLNRGENFARNREVGLCGACRECAPSRFVRKCDNGGAKAKSGPTSWEVSHLPRRLGAPSRAESSRETGARSERRRPNARPEYFKVSVYSQAKKSHLRDFAVRLGNEPNKKTVRLIPIVDFSCERWLKLSSGADFVLRRADRRPRRECNWTK